MTERNRGLNGKTSVFVVDDHPIVRRGLKLLLGLEPDFYVCGEAENGLTALEKIPALKPDVAIVDLSHKSNSGLWLIKELRALLPELKILVFTMQNEETLVERALRAGAKGYITKEEGTEKVIEGLRQIKSGKMYFNPQVAGAFLQRLSHPGKAAQDPVETLSDRELEVLQLVGQGLSSRQISERLRLSLKTVESHREHIKTKLGIKRATELVNFAFHWTHDR